MNRRVWMVLGASWVAPAARSLGQPMAPPAPDFKIMVGSFALGPEPISTEEIVGRQGRIYQFRSGSAEVVLIDPAGRRVELIDLSRKVQTEVSFARLDDAVAKVGAKLRAAIAEREKTGKRADAIEARMTRDMVEPGFRKIAVARAHHLRLANGTIEIDADGEPEPDAARLDSETLALETIAKLGAFLTPDDLPPFAELDAIAALKAERLRPAEIAYLYRLAGPPRKFRRTYRLVPDLTDREREAVARIDRVRAVATMLRYERYRAQK